MPGLREHQRLLSAQNLPRRRTASRSGRWRLFVGCRRNPSRRGPSAIDYKPANPIRFPSCRPGRRFRLVEVVHRDGRCSRYCDPVPARSRRPQARRTSSRRLLDSGRGGRRCASSHDQQHGRCFTVDHDGLLGLEFQRPFPRVPADLMNRPFLSSHDARRRRHPSETKMLSADTGDVGLERSGTVRAGLPVMPPPQRLRELVERIQALAGAPSAVFQSSLNSRNVVGLLVDGPDIVVFVDARRVRDEQPSLPTPNSSRSAPVLIDFSDQRFAAAPGPRTRRLSGRSDAAPGPMGSRGRLAEVRRPIRTNPQRRGFRLGRWGAALGDGQRHTSSHADDDERR